MTAEEEEYYFNLYLARLEEQKQEELEWERCMKEQELREMLENLIVELRANAAEFATNDAYNGHIGCSNPGLVGNWIGQVQLARRILDEYLNE